MQRPKPRHAIGGPVPVASGCQPTASSCKLLCLSLGPGGLEPGGATAEVQRQQWSVEWQLWAGTVMPLVWPHSPTYLPPMVSGRNHMKTSFPYENKSVTRPSVPGFSQAGLSAPYVHGETNTFPAQLWRAAYCSRPLARLLLCEGTAVLHAHPSTQEASVLQTWSSYPLGSREQLLCY